MYECVPDAQRGQKRVLDPFEVELQEIVSCYIETRNQTQVFSKGSKCF